jgi:hypothetical protein
MEQTALSKGQITKGNKKAVSKKIMLGLLFTSPVILGFLIFVL